MCVRYADVGACVRADIFSFFLHFLPSFLLLHLLGLWRPNFLLLLRFPYFSLFFLLILMHLLSIPISQQIPKSLLLLQTPRFSPWYRVSSRHGRFMSLLSRQFLHLTAWRRPKCGIMSSSALRTQFSSFPIIGVQLAVADNVPV